MLDHEKYMCRCLQLAKNGLGYVSPNPMVGAVVVYDGRIIGEGYHREYGKAHAEVNAISSVKDKSLLKYSTLYVSLEPCSHHGKTPPCSQLIIDNHIPKVVIATLDNYHKVSGQGVEILKQAGVEVTLGVLQDEAQSLNKEFFTSHSQKRPYIYLKWAQTKDGFIDKNRLPGDLATPTPISNDLTRLLVHKLRSEVDGVMIATNTAVNDNPSLTTRFWFGNNATRIVLDRNRRIPDSYHLFDHKVDTIIYTEKKCNDPKTKNLLFAPLLFDEDMIYSLLKDLNKKKINSILIEGGASLLQSFIDAGVWDEACIEIADIEFVEGVKAPCIDGKMLKTKKISNSQTIHLENRYKYKIL